MGSFQQIAISTVCLGIAFGFGAYVNTHPSGPASEDAELAQKNESDSNSNEAIADLDFVEKRPATMGMMRNPLKPRLALPSNSFGNNSITQPPVLPAPSDLGSRVEDQSPPPPSSSDSHNVSDPQVPLFEDLGPPGIAQANDIPDFSEAVDDAAAMQSGPKLPRKVLRNRIPESLENERSNQIASKAPPEPATPQTVPEAAPLTPLSDPLAAPVIEPFESAFTANDFEPQLHGEQTKSAKIKSLSQPPSALVERTPRKQNELAKTFADSNPLPTNLTFSIDEPSEIDTRRRIPFKLNTARTEELRDVRARSKSYDNFQEHIVRENESLQSISTNYFGKPDFYLDIYLANRENLLSPVGIKPGTKLKIPKIK
ncbi:MAG: LysM peptidoglycan-binding domain-containing protein [Planctomycetaceae bacterium]|nr:LysM peptidoglycan-binding domain-containing protein [Planctomycetaceae bacterium]MCP4776067.1 LysM peptidoglycan-binding domain-containing protein [Planctomycetaceae bacterium]